eukprot:TRINITY_DN20194_c0_g1_i1.p1 TRINITY_DN20194_c0_g1~~TRINITY_DN20194_c0_g1_i1.p1  ORF type:complete len:348 (-),score=94.01 TRINITY_DN20194_c0_g1_i1:133-1176(-)
MCIRDRYQRRVRDHVSASMAGEGLAVQYLMTMMFMGISSWFFFGYVAHLPEVFSKGSVMALKLLNPGWLPRVMIVVPAYFSLTLRGGLRMWSKHGFRICFMLVTLVYLSATLGAATKDDPYSVVGASSSSTTKQIRKLCRKKSLEYHPDKNPGNEDGVRPMFELVSRSCKTLTDPKKKSAYDRFGVVDKEETKGEDEQNVITGHLGWLSAILFYATLGLGLPVALIYNYGHIVKSEEDRMETAVSSAKSLHEDLLALYQYGHFGSATLDCAELYLNLGKWELIDQAAVIKEITVGSKSSKISSLANAHADRHALWLMNRKNDDQKVIAADKKLAQDWFSASTKAKSS